MEEKDIKIFKELIKFMAIRMNNYELNGLSQPELQCAIQKSENYSYIITLEKTKN